MSAGGRHRSFSTFDDAMEYDIRKLTDYLWELPRGGPTIIGTKTYGKLRQRRMGQSFWITIQSKRS